MPTKKRHHKNLNLDFELPPNTLSKNTNISSSKLRRRKSRSYLDDDTPKAFARLMSSTLPSHKRKRGGEEDTGQSSSRQHKKPNSQKQAPGNTNQQAEKHKLTILPGESLRAFNKRVDASMPVPLKGKGGLTKSEEAELFSKKTKTKKAPVEEPAEEEEDYSDYLTDSSAYSIDSSGEPRPKTFHPRPSRPIKKATKKPNQKANSKSRRGASPDPFAVLLERRAKARFGETAEAPPEFKIKPKEILKARGGGGAAGGADIAEIPKAAGSIARREMLADERRSVVERYREMMDGKRGSGQS